MISRFIIALLFVGLNLYVYRYFATEDYKPPRENFAEFPLQIESWECRQSQEMTENVLDRLGVTDYLLCDFRNTEDSTLANVYVGYHASQTRNVGGKENMIHPPEHCLPGSGWDIIASDVVSPEWFPSGEIKRVVIAKGNQRSLVYFWYQSRGRVIARNHEKIFYMFLDRASSRRTDGSLVRFTIPIVRGDEEGAEETFRELVQQISPLLPDYVPN
ncbi:MAG: EpsI family protein [bacterium TMED88]|nr:EpsI family protein [Deltaproteobacteria bacterium]OUV33219.1 MAG: EpsI family protein [bacterium TMED88]